MPTNNPATEQAAEPYCFHFGPFRFRSEIDIPELRASTGAGTHSVEILLGGVPDSIPGLSFDDGVCMVSDREFLLNIAGTARYYVRDGNQVRVEIAPGAPRNDVSIYLLGSVFGVLCHQNGMLPLHASAIASNGEVTAFLGNSGAGKSTLAACLRRRGHIVVSDDICLLQPDSAGDLRSLHVVPVAGWLKLWNTSLDHLGERPEEHNRVFSTDDKFRVYLDEPNSVASPAPARLRRAIFLHRADEPDAAPTLLPVPLLEAITGLMEMTYVGYVPDSSGQRGRLFQLCAAALNGAEALRLSVPWSLDRMEDTLDLLEAKLLEATQPADPVR